MPIDPAPLPASRHAAMRATSMRATSTLILGESSAILVDAQFTLSEGAKVAEWIAGTGKQLQAIYITHAHPDHYFGVVSVLERFPGTPVYTKAVVREHMLAHAAKDLEEWKPAYGDELPDEPVFPEMLEADFLTLEGHRIDIMPLEQADMEDVTAVHIPGIDTVITGDLTYRGMHAWLAETDKQGRAAWLCATSSTDLAPGGAQRRAPAVLVNPTLVTRHLFSDSSSFHRVVRWT
jgi:glyoxylase-like metal-dependent hydrolase (beta-lactamase superfamily II)